MPSRAPELIAVDPVALTRDRIRRPSVTPGGDIGERVGVVALASVDTVPFDLSFGVAAALSLSFAAG
jgi:hypothetical protein